MDANHFLRSFIRFLRSFISPPRGECCMPTWRIRNFQVGVAEFLRRDRKAPLGTIRAKRGTICGTRIYYRVNTIRVTLCRDARLVSSEMASVPVKGYCVIALTQRTHIVRPYNRYTSRFDTTDAVTFDTTDTLPLNTHRASLHQLLVRFAGSTMRGVWRMCRNSVIFVSESN